MSFRMQRPRWLAAGRWAVCLGATLAAIALHAIYLSHAGALWRDETSSVNLATMPTAGDMWRALDVPVLFPTVLRVWCAIGLGHSDFSLRVFGFLVGVSILGAFWLNARVMGIGIPYVSLGLLAINITLVRWGDSLRAYGLGSLLMLLTLGQIWALATRPDFRRFLPASLLAVLSVHCLYQNAIMLAAGCSGACLVCLLHKNRLAAGLVLVVGLVAAVSLLPYFLHVTQFSNAYKVLRTGFDAHVIWSNLSTAIGSPPFLGQLLWPGLLVLVGGIGVASLDQVRRGPCAVKADLPLFGAVAAGVAVAGFFVFLGLAQLPTQPWYYLPIMTCAAFCMDVTLAPWLSRHQAWGLAFVGLAVCASLPTALSYVAYRQTNMDLLAASLQKQAKPNDLIVVYPWFNGISFNRYYHGTTAWTTLPAIADSRLHRYDLVKERLAAKAPIQPVLDRILQTRAAGNSIWIVGELPTPQPEETGAPDLPPAPDSPYNWSDVPYNYVWGLQTRRFIAVRCGHIEVVSTNSGAPVSPYERLSLSVVKGWNPP